MAHAFSVIQSFPAAKSCIYCGKAPPEVALTLEHIIPLGLKGYYKLPKSCRGCANIIKKFEQRALRNVLGNARIHSGMGWGHPKEQPTHRSVKVKTAEGFEMHSVTIEDHPFVMAMVDVYPPGILWSETKVDRYERVRVVFHNLQGDTNERANRTGKGRGVRLEQVAASPDFWRLLAKIGHAFASASVAEIGPFEPFLLDIILRNEMGDGPNLIGGGDEHTPPSPNVERNVLHDIWLTKAKKPGDASQAALVVVCVRLFACFGMPTYQVVVGCDPS